MSSSELAGFWFFHCHLEFHALHGMSMIIQAGETWEMPSAPPRMARCGDFSISEEEFLAAERHTPEYHSSENEEGSKCRSTSNTLKERF